VSLAAASAVRYEVGSAVLVGGIDLAVEPWEVVGLIGPNGAGKTTLLRLLAGDLLPSGGAVTLGGDATGDLDPSAAALLRSMLPGTSPGDVPFTAGSVVLLGRYPHRRDPDNSASTDRAAVADAMAKTDTSHLIERVYATLSGGEQTRVSLARVLAQQAPLMLLDEPTRALDLGHEELIMGVLRTEAEGGTGVVVVLHDLNAAAAYADRLVLLEEGRVRREGTPDEVLVPDVLSDVYRHRVEVIRHPFRPCPLVVAAG
jgi:iron complex transport system ATP-binding protein